MVFVKLLAYSLTQQWTDLGTLVFLSRTKLLHLYPLSCFCHFNTNSVFRCISISKLFVIWTFKIQTSLVKRSPLFSPRYAIACLPSRCCWDSSLNRFWLLSFSRWLESPSSMYMTSSMSVTSLIFDRLVTSLILMTSSMVVTASTLSWLVWFCCCGKSKFTKYGMMSRQILTVCFKASTWREDSIKILALVKYLIRQKSSF